MRGLAYRNVIDEGPRLGEAERKYVLQLGSVELRPISFATLVGLGNRSEVVCEVLDLCFVDRPVMWADPEAIHPGDYRARLSEIEALLQGVDFRLKSSERPCDRVLARIVELWHGLTHEAVVRLEAPEDSEATLSARSVVADYRRAIYACVEALLQLLPNEYECARETEEKLLLGRQNLVGVLGVEPEQIDHAGWRSEDSASEEPGFVTWGIP